jgi:hypothetical protein
VQVPERRGHAGRHDGGRQQHERHALEHTPILTRALVTVNRRVRRPETRAVARTGWRISRTGSSRDSDVVTRQWQCGKTLTGGFRARRSSGQAPGGSSQAGAPPGRAGVTEEATPPGGRDLVRRGCAPNPTRPLLGDPESPTPRPRGAHVRAFATSRAVSCRGVRLARRDGGTGRRPVTEEATPSRRAPRQET